MSYSKRMNQPDKVANPTGGQLNRENEHFPVPVGLSPFVLSYIYIVYSIGTYRRGLSG